MAIPVTLEDAKRQLKVELDDNERDEEISGFITNAVAWIEDYTGHILQARDVTAQFGSFSEIAFREWPIAADATPAVTYTNGGVETPVADVRAVISRRPVRVLPLIGSRWPLVPAGTGATVTIRAGYDDGDPVPGIIRQVMLMLIAAYDDDREGGDAFIRAEKTARSLCRSLRINRL